MSTQKEKAIQILDTLSHKDRQDILSRYTPKRKQPKRSYTVKSASPVKRPSKLATRGRFMLKSKKSPKTGAEIAAMLEAMEPIEFVDNHIEDPVEWLEVQRQKEADRLKNYQDETE